MKYEIEGLLDKAEGLVLSDATLNSDGTYQSIKNKLREYGEQYFEECDNLGVELVSNALETLEYSIKDIKPFE